jgi:hypothetical protein
MICGDATGGTENYIRRTYNISDLDVLQVPHHGSKLTSSTPLFVQKMQPLNCIISAPRNSSQHHHPDKEVIDAYLASGRIQDLPQHVVYYWEEVGGGYQTVNKFITKALYITGSYGTCMLTASQDGLSIATP